MILLFSSKSIQNLSLILYYICVSTYIGVERFKILEGQGLEYWGWGQGGADSLQAHDVISTSCAH